MSKQCAGEWKTGASGKQRCARYENPVDIKEDVVIARSDDDQDVGFVDVAGAFGALSGGDAWSYLAPLWGGSVALIGTLVAKKLGSTRPNVHRFAGLIGAGASIVGSVPMYWIRGAGGDAVRSGALTGAAVGLGLFAVEEISKMDFMSGMGIVSAERQLSGVVASGSANVLPTASVPRNVRPAMDVSAFAHGV